SRSCGAFQRNARSEYVSKPSGILRCGGGAAVKLAIAGKPEAVWRNVRRSMTRSYNTAVNAEIRKLARAAFVAEQVRRSGRVHRIGASMNRRTEPGSIHSAWIVFFFLSAIHTVPAAVRFEDFASSQGVRLAGDAAISGNVLRLTPSQANRSGAAWFGEKQPVTAGFETTFQFQLTQEGGIGHGADGFAFVLQNSGPASLGGLGSAGGFAVAAPGNGSQKGIPWSIAVFFDTHRNKEEGDPSGNYIALRTYGRPAEMRWPATRLAFTRKLHVHLKDRKAHTARIVFRPPVLSVYLDASITPVLQTAVDVSIVADSQGRAWAGFTASTGAGYENHDILNWSFAGEDVHSSVAVVTSDITFPMSACLPDRNLCTPERA